MTPEEHEEWLSVLEKRQTGFSERLLALEEAHKASIRPRQMPATSEDEHEQYLKQQPHALPVTASNMREKVLVRLGVDDGEARFYITPEQVRCMANMLRDAAERADREAKQCH